MASKSLSFIVCSAWNAIRLASPKVAWASFIWFKGAVPKHSFICWLTLLDRLPTKLRLFKYMAIDVACVFCGAPESRDHLFFICPFTSQVWKRVFDTIGKPGPHPLIWDQFLLRAQSALKRNTALNQIMKLGVNACIYNTWLERNSRIHSRPSRNVLFLTQSILLVVRFRIMGVPRLKNRFSESDFQFTIYDHDEFSESKLPLNFRAGMADTLAQRCPSRSLRLLIRMCFALQNSESLDAPDVLGPMMIPSGPKSSPDMDEFFFAKF